MMQLNLPVTPLANGMWSLGTELTQATDVCRFSQSSVSEQSVQQPRTVQSVAVPQAPATTSTSTPHRKQELGAPYRSVDSHTGRVWGAPNAGGRGQCFDCPNRAMATNRRCESCLRALAQVVYEQMSSSDLQELKSALRAALARLSESRCKDAAERLERLYSLLQAGRISPPIQSQLLTIARAIASNNYLAAGQVVASLSTQHWEEHKDWLMGMKRLLSAQ